jgi:hypothetical protein
VYRQPPLVFRQSAIDDQELLLHEQAFRDDGPRTTAPQEFGDCGEKTGGEYQ